MNRAYRHIWSAAHGTYLIAPETARGKGKSGRSLVAPAAFGFLAMFAFGVPAALAGPVKPPVATTVVPAVGQKVDAYLSANGVPVVNINAANAAGVSHNQFTRYNVESKGLVLNNSSFAKAVTSASQLAGQVLGNMNLANEAKLIVNEVVAPGRSTLAGYTEVLGTRADVVVANPYGITCAGCGFINSDRVTLTTGAPVWADGSLAGVNVSGGDILVQGTGLNASAQQILDLVARSVRLDGQVNGAEAGTLGIVAGANQWSYSSRSVTGAATASGDVPGYAIDSSALGGMYAGRIRLIATEAGVGVRMLGDAAASAADFDLDAAGKVQLQGRLSAAADIKLAQAALDVSGAGASLTAQRDLDINTQGAASLNEVVLKAGAGIRLTAASLADKSASTAGRSAATDMVIKLSGDASLDGASWGAGGRMSLEAAALSVGDTGTTLYSGANAASADRTLMVSAIGDMALGKAKLTSTGDLSLRAAALRSSALAEMAAAGDVTLTAATGVEHAGSIVAGKNLALNAGAAEVLKVANSGLLQAQGALRLGQANQPLALSNAGAGRLLGGTIALDTTALDNAGVVQATDGLNVTSAGSIDNRAGAVLLSTAAGSALNLKASSLDNAGRLQSAGALDAKITGATKNAGELLTTRVADGGSDGALALASGTLDNSGLVAAAGTGKLDIGSTLDNRKQIQASTLSIKTGAGLSNTGADSLLLAQGDLDIDSASFDSAGTVQGGAELSITAAKSLSNSGVLQTRDDGGKLALQGGTISNSGTVQAAGAASAVSRGGAINNNGKVLAGADLDMRAATALNNANANSVLLSGSALDLRADNISNIGTVQAGSSAGLTASGGAIDNGGLVSARSTVDLSARDAIGNRGVLVAGTGLTARGGSFTSSGKVQSDGDMAITSRGLFNNSGAMQARDDGATMSISGTTFYNSGVMQAAGAGFLTSTSGVLDNAGQVSAGGSLKLESADRVRNLGAGSLLLAQAGLDAAGTHVENQGKVQAGTSLAINASATISNTSVIQNLGAADALTLSGTAITNSGTVQAAGTAILSATSGTLENSGKLLAAGDLDLSAASLLHNKGAGSSIVGEQDIRIAGPAGASYSVTNDGRIQADGALSIGSAGERAVSYTNSNGAKLLGNALELHAGQIGNQGRIQAMSGASLSGTDLDNLGSTAVILLGLDEAASSVALSGTLYNQGAIHGGGSLVIDAAGITNTNTAGISSLKSLTLNASTHGISNAGALYAADALGTSASGQTITNTSSGTMDATDITISAGTFSNYNTVIAGNDANITTTVAFNNLPTGTVPNIVTASVAYGPVTVPFDTGEMNCNIFGDYCDHLWVYAQDFKLTQGLDGPMPVQKGQIIAASTINLNYGMAGNNTASLISAPNINISGTGTFTNKDLHLDEIDYARRWRVYKTDSTFGSLNYDYRYPTSSGEFGCNGGDCFSGHAGSGDAAADGSYQLETGRTTIQVWSAGIYATNLNFAGGSLKNLGSPYTRGTSATTVGSDSAATVAPLAGTAFAPLAAVAAKTLAGKAVSSDSRAVAVSAVKGVSFAGLNLTLPTNPNGYFVPAKNPTSNFLVETNPLFGAGSKSVGSDYLSSLLGINPDVQQKRLGDANYEAKLIRDQLVAQTGNNIIKGQKNEAAQVQSLMDNAAKQVAGLGLVFGQPLSPEQADALTEDMVWMVETEVGGQKVLAPVVYLAKSTREAIEGGGPVIAATNANIKAGTLENRGGTIAGDKLAITTEGDLRNTGGKIKGGEVSLTATNGSIINETVAESRGGKDFMRTVIGAAGSIESTGNLSMDAGKDILVKGAAIKAGGEASLAAGGSVTFDTIEDKRADATYKASEGLWGLSKSSTSTRDASTTNIGSTLETGGGLKIKSGADTTIAGSSVKVGGNLELDAGGDVNLVSRQDTVESMRASSKSGLGVGGGVYGSTTTTTDAFKGRNAGATLEVGGDASLSAANTLTVQGSKLKVGGDAAISAQDVQVLAGQDVDRTSTTTTTTSFLKVSAGGSSNAEAGAGANAQASASGNGKNASAKARADAAAGASASASGNAGLTLAETSTTTSMDYKSRAVGSELDIGNNLTVNAKKDIVLQGATVNAGGDVDLKATDVKILASQDIDISTSKTTTTSIGFFVESENKAEAGASAGAGAAADSKRGNGNAGAEVGARAGASASSDTTIDLARTTTTETNSMDITNTGSTINAGGKLKVDADNKLLVQGSDIGGEKGVALKAKDMAFVAAEDVSVTSTSTTRVSAGLYVSGGANAEAGASANVAASNGTGNAGGGGAAGAGASADAKVGAGWQAKVSTEKTTDGSTTARVSSIRSGSGDIERTAQNNILDVGTEIEAAGDFSQSAETIDSRAAKNTTFSTSESETNTLKLGVYAQANAEASGSASASADASVLGSGSGNEGQGSASANASAGIEAQYTNEQGKSRSDSSEAVVSTIKAGGKVSSKSNGKTTFEGTQISGDGGVELEAGEIDFKAARNTESSSESGLSVNAAANIGLNLGSSGAVEGGVSGGFEKNDANASSSTAVAGSIQSGAGLSIKTKGDARFEGTDIGAAGDASVSAGGKLAFDAARNESSESSTSANAQVSLSVSKSKGAGGSESEAGLSAEAGYGTESARSSEAVAGKIAAGGNLTLSAGGDARFEGTQIQAGGDTSVEAGGNVDFAAARNTSSSESLSVSASLALSGSSSDSGTGESSKSKGGGIGLEAGYSKERSSEAVAGTIESGGNLKIKSGGNATFEGTDVAAVGGAAIAAGGNVAFKAAESTSESVSLGLSLGAEGSNTQTTTKPAAGAPDAAAGPVSEKERSGSIGFEAGVEKSSDKKGGSIKAGAGGIAISSGANASFEGTTVKSDGDIGVAARGDVSITTARSTSSSLGVSVGAEAASSSKTTGSAGAAGSAAAPAEKTSSRNGSLGLDAGMTATNEGASFESGGKLNIASGGRTTMVSTETKAAGGQQITAAGGVTRSTARDVDVGVSVSLKGQSETPAPAAAAAEPAAAPVAEQAAPVKVAPVAKPKPPVKKAAAAKTAPVVR